MVKNVAVIGAGYWGKNLVRNFYELGVLHTVCDIRKELLDSIKKNYKNVETDKSFKNVLDNQGIEVVAVATPAALHYKMVKEALLAGKDVFVEKPLALTVKEGQELVDLADRREKVLMVGHILQYHPAVEKLKDLITAGELGKIQYIYSNRLNIGKLRTEENILWSFAPHDISIILMLLGEEPVKVSAFGGAYVSEGIYDTTMTTMEFSNGIRAHIFVSWLHPIKEQKLVVVGSKAMAVFDDISTEKLFLFPHKIRWKDGKIPIAQKANYYVIPIGNEEPLKQELRHFIGYVNERKKPKTDGQEGLRVLSILEAAEISLLGEDNRSRRGDRIGYYAHETSCIDDGVHIGAGTKIWHYSHILKGTIIGKNCIIGQNVSLGPDVNIGDGCKIQNNVSIYKGVTIEDDVFCGPSCVFTNVYNPREHYQFVKKEGHQI